VGTIRLEEKYDAVRRLCLAKSAGTLLYDEVNRFASCGGAFSEEIDGPSPHNRRNASRFTKIAASAKAVAAVEVSSDPGRPRCGGQGRWDPRPGPRLDLTPGSLEKPNTILYDVPERDEVPCLC